MLAVLKAPLIELKLWTFSVARAANGTQLKIVKGCLNALRLSVLWRGDELLIYIQHEWP